MSDTAPFVKPSEPIVVEQEQLQVEHLLVTQDVTLSRLEHCLSCEHLNRELQDIPKCNQCDCSISMLTTITFKVCPIGKW